MKSRFGKTTRLSGKTGTPAAATAPEGTIATPTVPARIAAMASRRLRLCNADAGGGGISGASFQRTTGVDVAAAWRVAKLSTAPDVVLKKTCGRWLRPLRG